MKIENMQYEADEIIASLEALEEDVPEALQPEFQERLQELSTAAGEIESSGLISRITATRLANEHGVDFGHRYPTISFTMHESPTNVGPALENIAITIKEAVIKAWLAFLEKVKQFGSWLKDKFQTGFKLIVDQLVKVKEYFTDKGAEPEKVAEAIQVANGLTGTLKSTNAADSNEVQNQVNELKMQLKNVERWAQDGIPDTILDFLEEGPAYKAVNPVLQAFPAVVNLYETTMRGISQTSNRDDLKSVMDRYDSQLKAIYRTDANLPGEAIKALADLGERVPVALDDVAKLAGRSKVMALHISNTLTAGMSASRRVDFKIIEHMVENRVREIKSGQGSYSAAERTSDNALLARMNKMMRDYYTLLNLQLRVGGVATSTMNFWAGYTAFGNRLLVIIKRLGASDVEFDDHSKREIARLEEALNAIG